MFFKQLKKLFLLITLLSLLLLIFFWYEEYQFKNNNLSDNIKLKIAFKHKELQKLASLKLGINTYIPITISTKMPSRLFGAATYSKNKKIEIFLNKNHFKESLDYMIEDVLPHEYAHAIMFLKGNFTNKNGGHTIMWQNTCKVLQGLRCDRFVNKNDIIIGKTKFF